MSSDKIPYSIGVFYLPDSTPPAWLIRGSDSAIIQQGKRKTLKTKTAEVAKSEGRVSELDKTINSRKTDKGKSGS